jgi:hypothetical protein
MYTRKRTPYTLKLRNTHKTKNTRKAYKTHTADINYNINIEANHAPMYNKLEHKDLTFIGEGSYGHIYGLPTIHFNKVIKTHSIANNKDTHCISWEKEYNLQRNIYNTCTPIFKILNIPIHIVKPYHFSYGNQTENTIIAKKNSQNSNICYFSMERIYGMIYFHPSQPKNIQTNINSHENNINRIYHDTTPYLNNGMIQQMDKLLQISYTTYIKHIYPYHVFLGTSQHSTDQITLPAIKGSTLIQLYREEIQYCICEGPALEYMYQMILSFFVLITQGFMPRDIEYVLHGNDLDSVFSMLDFNEAETIKERKLYKGKNYNLAEDIAHVYIDICGVRKSREEKNPQIPYNHGTPSWKFLSNPLVSPQAFFVCIDRVKETLYNVLPFDDIIKTIYNYIYTSYFKNTFDKFHKQYQRLKEWKPRPFFTHTKSTKEDVIFDMDFQKYIVLKLCETLILQNNIQPEDIEEFLTMDYPTLLDTFHKIYTKKSYTVDEDDTYMNWL